MSAACVGGTKSSSSHGCGTTIRPVFGLRSGFRAVDTFDDRDCTLQGGSYRRIIPGGSGCGRAVIAACCFDARRQEATCVHLAHSGFRIYFAGVLINRRPAIHRNTPYRMGDKALRRRIANPAEIVTLPPRQQNCRDYFRALTSSALQRKRSHVCTSVIQRSWRVEYLSFPNPTWGASLRRASVRMSFVSW
jgi:hypothetical protein